MPAFNSAQLLQHEADCLLPSLDYSSAIHIGEIATKLGMERSLPVIIEVRFDGRTVYKTALAGSKVESESWIVRKARVVELKHHFVYIGNGNQNWFFSCKAFKKV